MSDDRPLDALVPGLVPAPLPGGARLIEATIAGAPAWVLALDQDPGGAAALQRWIAQHLEAAILARVSVPGPRVTGEVAPGYGVAPTGGVHLLTYATVAGNVARALEPYGLKPSTLGGTRWDEIRAALGKTPPSGTYSARVRAKDGVAALHAALVEDTLEPWGIAPGRPAERLLHLAEDVTGAAIAPDRAGLDAVEALIVDTTPGVIRWMPPLVLQALADLMGLVAEQSLGARIAWAECAPEVDGFAPPPWLRVEARTSGGEPAHIPIGQHLVQWCVMPLSAGERPPPLSAWLAHEVGA